MGRRFAVRDLALPEVPLDSQVSRCRRLFASRHVVQSVAEQQSVDRTTRRKRDASERRTHASSSVSCSSSRRLRLESDYSRQLLLPPLASGDGGH